MKNLLIALSLAVLGVTLVGSSAQAQREGFASAPAGRGGAAVARGHSGNAGGAARGRGRGYYPGWGYGPYGPYFLSDLGYDYDLGFDSDNEPPLPIVTGESLRSAAPKTPPRPAGGLELLELQGDRLVRITPNAQPPAVAQAKRPQPEKAANQPTAAPSAVLVFRDGHTEEIGKYCIMGETIHIDADYWSTGSWTRTVKLSDLDVPATLKLNQQRGTHFRVPSGPYEVMIGG